MKPSEYFEKCDLLSIQLDEDIITIEQFNLAHEKLLIEFKKNGCPEA